MLLSMTGQGQGRRQVDAYDITAEVRAVNNRHLKIHLRTPDHLASLESRIEAEVRSALRRGSLQLSVQVSGGELTSQYHLQADVLERYLHQCWELSERLGIENRVTVADLLALPGAVADTRSALGTDGLDASLVDAVLGTVGDALACLNKMRQAEGDSIATELLEQIGRLEELAGLIAARSPQVVVDYRERLSKRLNKTLAELGQEASEADTLREVLLLADRTDIREELVRLQSHFEQFRRLTASDQSQGRKLDFLIQEMFREANTIGSKASDAEIAQRVVDVKTILEQMREQVQNVE